MVITAISSTVDGSVVIGIDMNVSEANQELAKLKKKIQKTEKELDDLTERRAEAQKSLNSGLLDSEKEKLAQMVLAKKVQKQLFPLLEKTKQLEGEISAAQENREKALEKQKLVQTSILNLQKQIEQLESSPHVDDEVIKNKEMSLRSFKAELEAENAKIRDSEKDISDFRKDLAEIEEKINALPKVSEKVYSDEAISDQKTLVRGLQTEWNKTASSIEKYNAKIEDVSSSLISQIDDAASLQRQISEAEEEAKKFGVSDQRVVDLNKELVRLKDRQKELSSIGIGFGYKEFDQNAAAISRINHELKEYQKNLSEIAADMRDLNQEIQVPQPAPELDRQAIAYEKQSRIMERLKTEISATGELARMAGKKISTFLAPSFAPVYNRMKPALDRIRERIINAFQPLRERIAPDMEYAKESIQIGLDGIRNAIHQKLLPDLKEAGESFSLVARRAGEAFRGIPEKIGSLFRRRRDDTFGAESGDDNSPLTSIAGAADPKAAAAMAAIEKVKTGLAKLKTGLARVRDAAVKAGGVLKSAFLGAAKAVGTAGKSVVGLVKKMNVFSRLSDRLGGKFKRLGSTIKSALVFSVIYKGLSLMREQIGKYLSVNVQLTTALRRLQGVLLTAFQPIYEVVVPALTTLINVLTRAAATVTQFFASLFGTTAKQAQTNAKDLYEQANATTAAGDAAEEAAKQLADFDEIKKLEGNKSAGGGGSASVDTGPLFDYEYDETPFDSWGAAFSGFLDKLLAGIPKLRDAFKKFADWLNDWSKKVYDMFTFPGVLDKVKQLGRELAEALNQLVKDINWYQLGQALGAGLNLALNFLTSFLYTFDWMNLGRKLAEFINGLVHEIEWYEFGRLLWAGFKIALETLAGFLLGLDMPQLAQAASEIVKGFFDEMVNTIRRIPWYKIGAQISDFLNNIDWYGVVKSVIRGIQAALRAMQQAVAGFVNTLKWSEIAEAIYTAINDSLGNINWRQMGETVGDLFIHIFDFLREVIAGIDWAQIGRDIAAFLNGIDWIGLLSSLAGAIAAGINAAVHALGALVADLDWAEVGRAVGEAFNRLMEDIDWEGVGKLLNDGLLGLIEAAGNFLRTIDCSAIGRALTDTLKEIDWGTLLLELCELIVDLFVVNLKFVFFDLKALLEIGIDIVEGILKGILEGITNIGGLPAWLKEHVVDPFVEAFKSLLGIHSPSTVMAEQGGYIIDGLLKGISDTWHTIVDFFSGKLDDLKKTLSDAWEDIKKTASDKWEGIKKAIGDKWDAIRDSAKTKFEEIRRKVSEAWDNVKADVSSKWDEIKSALSDAWDRVKTAAGEKFNSIKETIIEKFEGLKEHNWFTIGEAIVSGIVKGLQTIWNTLTGWVRDVKNAIDDALSGTNSRGGGFGSNRSSGFGGGSRAMVQAMPDISAFNVPRLAQGAVIPPNREFLAVLGDQKRGTNIETPLPTMVQAFKQAMGEMGMRNGNMTVIMEIDGREFGRASYKYGTAEQQRVGVRLAEAHT